MLEDIYGNESIYASSESVYDQYTGDSIRLEQNSIYTDHQNSPFNVKANHLGDIGVIDRMSGLVARREDMTFGDISLAENYMDKSLDTRVMGGLYNYTLSDIYTDRNRYLAVQGMQTFGGLIQDPNEKYKSVFMSESIEKESPFSKTHASKILGSKGVLGEESVFDSLSNEVHFSSPGVMGNGKSLEVNTIYSLEGKKKNNSSQKSVKMSDLVDKNSSFTTEDSFDSCLSSLSSCSSKAISSICCNSTNKRKKGTDLMQHASSKSSEYQTASGNIQMQEALKKEDNTNKEVKSYKKNKLFKSSNFDEVKKEYEESRESNISENKIKLERMLQGL